MARKPKIDEEGQGVPNPPAGLETEELEAVDSPPADQPEKGWEVVALRSACIGGTAVLRPGRVAVLPPAVAQSLIERGMVERRKAK